MKKYRQFFFLLCCFALVFTCKAQEFNHTIALEEGQSSPKASLDQVAWITGHWEGEAFGGHFEEIWSSPKAGSMMAMFKLWADGQVQFYELITIAEVDGSLVLKLKHFGADLKGWEEKDEMMEMPLVKLEENIVYFNNYTFELKDEDTIHCYVIIEEKGAKEEVQFVFKRVKE